jgi:hypothetical protein
MPRFYGQSSRNVNPEGEAKKKNPFPESVKDRY